MGDVGHSGRHGGTFFFCVMIVGACGLAGLAIFLWCGHSIFGEYFPRIAGVALMVIAAWIAPPVLRRFKKGPKYRIEPLSREEMKRARSKLLGRQPIKRL